MYSFIKQYTETMKGAHIYAFISLFIFLLFFIALLFFVKKMGKDKAIELSNIPFDKEDSNNSNN